MQTILILMTDRFGRASFLLDSQPTILAEACSTSLHLEILLTLILHPPWLTNMDILEFQSVYIDLWT